LTDHYQSATLLGQYLDFHYRSTDPVYLPHHSVREGLLDYPKRCAQKLIQHHPEGSHALDLGCAVGGSSFELATVFDRVTGIDFSAAFIAAATDLAEKGIFRTSEHITPLSSDVRKCTPEFRVGDACKLDPNLGPFDAILMANLLCRLPDPAACLQGLRAITRPGSTLVFTTPCSWDETYTPREKWLWPTLEGLHHHLDSWCDNLEVSNMPFLLKDHDRRAQYTIAQTTVWRVRSGHKPAS
jgi:SAM-dependent methyltransferase